MEYETLQPWLKQFLLIDVTKRAKIAWTLVEVGAYIAYKSRSSREIGVALKGKAY